MCKFNSANVFRRINMDDKGLLRRREFFKRAAGAVLPMLVVSSTPFMLWSCGDDNDDPAGCPDCSASCSVGCSNYCTNSAVNSDNPDDNNSDDNNNSNDSTISEATGTLNGYGYVDLGLSVKWATCNVGALVPEDFGNYIPIGGYVNDQDSWIEFFRALVASGIQLNTDFQGTQFDQATSMMGSYWKTPTEDDCNELINNCDFGELTVNGVKGFVFKSRKNGKSIFFPGAGKMYKGSNDASGSGCYWTSSITDAIDRGTKWLCLDKELALFPRALVIENKGYVSYHELPIRAITDGTTSDSTPSGCNGNCSANCANSSTSSGCSGCATSCSSGCRQNCDYNCAATCVGHCYGSCDNTCGGSCTYLSAGSKCSGCARTCSGRCYTNCTYACSSNCQSSCVHGSK